MTLLFVSFLAGMLTVLAPCILPVLPIIIGGSAAGRRPRNPFIITASLGLAVVFFTLLLKFSTLFVNVAPTLWSTLSGGLIIVFGLISLFPNWWDKISSRFGLLGTAEKNLSLAGTKSGFWGDVLIGAALGPVFSSCSPTYFIILASVLPTSFSRGVLYLIAYALGLSLVLLAIALLGQRLVKCVASLANPNGLFKRGLGLLFILVGIFIISGYDKILQAYLLEKGLYPGANIETNLLDSATPADNTNQLATIPTVQTPTKNFPRYREIAEPSGFVNTAPLTIGSLIGKKVILVDFMTYSCINCIRTFPYLNAWYDKYKSAGLEIIGIHTPEFAFEKNYQNVAAAMKKFGIKFPVVLDNNYGTWNAYGNSYWPRKYLIDIDGYVVFDHIGEGKYDETELKIQELLKEKMARDVATSTLSTGIVQPPSTTIPEAGSPETYFGAGRNEYLQNGDSKTLGLQNFSLPEKILSNALYLGGTWNFVPEYAENKTASDSVQYAYQAKNVYFVASANKPVRVEVFRDGKPLLASQAGADIVIENGRSYLTVEADRLYHLITEPAGPSLHTLELKIEAAGLHAYTFTFG